MEFGKILLGSIFDNCDLSKINCIHISDTGLKECDIRYIKSKYNKVKIVKTNVITEFETGGRWGGDWQKNINNKTEEYLKVLEYNIYPVIMIDADCMILKDLYCLIDINYDIQLCVRYSDSRKIPNCLASFFICNNAKSVEFIKKWRKIYKHLTLAYNNNPVESKSLEIARDIYCKKYKFKSHCVQEVAGEPDNYFEDEEYQKKVSIVHFKARGGFNSGLKNKRIIFETRTKHFRDDIQKYLKD